ncbi:MAG: molybdopterin cofactor-binding domain-containing protein [Cyclobacteriaceae bacterium]
MAISRRKFVLRTFLGGTGIVLGSTYLVRNPVRRAIIDMVDSADAPIYNGNTDDPLLWFEISPGTRIKLYSPKVEMGQGTFTSLVQIAADELEIPIDQIEIVHAPTASGNIDRLSTGGSNSVAGLFQPLRELSATMREMIRIQAAKQMGVPPGDAKVDQGFIVAGSTKKSFGEVVSNASEWEVPETPALKDLDSYHYVGKPIPRVDLEDKVYGIPMFGIDAELPGMLYGSVVRPDKIGSTLVNANISKAEKMPGVVKIIQEDDFIGIVAKSMFQAEKAKLAISAEWKTEKNWQAKDIEDLIRARNDRSMVIQTEGSAADFLKTDNDGYFESSYTSPLGAHAQLEPNGAVAHVEKDKATVYISTQVINLTRNEIAERLNLEEEKVNIIPTYLGGGFGRRLHTPHAVQAALLSRAVGKPVKCFFNRKEEFQNDTFRPPTHHTMRAKVSTEGRIEALEHDFASGHVMFGSALLPPIAGTILGADAGAIRGGLIQYKEIQNYRAISYVTELPFATSWWRSLGLLANTFAIESFMDELAEKVGKDPIQFRLDHIQNDEDGRRLKKVIKVAQENSNYTDEVTGSRAMGFAASTDAGTPCAQVVEVSIEGKRIKVEKVTCVIDPGFAVNPDQVKAQCEGAIIMGISASMFEKMNVENAELKPTNYGPYQMAMMRDAPREINIEIINGTGKPGAVGEPPLGPIGAAIANAVYRVAGRRLRDMPLKLA